MFGHEVLDTFVVDLMVALDEKFVVMGTKTLFHHSPSDSLTERTVLTHPLTIIIVVVVVVVTLSFILFSKCIYLFQPLFVQGGFH